MLQCAELKIAVMSALFLLAGCASAPPEPESPARTDTIHASEPESQEEPMTKPFVFRDAPLPSDYPPPGPVGEVIVKTYPASRFALVRSADLGGADSNGMFRPLLKHIQKNEISMTAPVVMGYQKQADRAQPDTMAFVYGNTKLGRPGADGKVNVQDVPAVTVISVGVRGSYDESHFGKGIALRHDWLAKNNSRYEVSGPPRYLAYNSPFVPWFMRYGEVQIPVRSN